MGLVFFQILDRLSFIFCTHNFCISISCLGATVQVKDFSVRGFSISAYPKEHFKADKCSSSSHPQARTEEKNKYIYRLPRCLLSPFGETISLLRGARRPPPRAAAADPRTALGPARQQRLPAPAPRHTCLSLSLPQPRCCCQVSGAQARILPLCPLPLRYGRRPFPATRSFPFPLAKSPPRPAAARPPPALPDTTPAPACPLLPAALRGSPGHPAAAVAYLRIQRGWLLPLATSGGGRGGKSHSQLDSEQTRQHLQPITLHWQRLLNEAPS